MTKSKSPKTVTIIDAILHRQLLGSLPAFKNLSTWAGWLVWLKAAFALPMNDEELAIYRQCTGRNAAPEKEPSETYTIVGRRGGKSLVSALTAVFVACFRQYRQYLNAGEQAVVLVLARDRDQAKIVFRYIKGILSAVSPLAQMIVNEKADEIELDNGVTIMVKTSDFRAIRGLTIALVSPTKWRFGMARESIPTRKSLPLCVRRWRPFPAPSFFASQPPMPRPACCSRPIGNISARRAATRLSGARLRG